MQFSHNARPCCRFMPCHALPCHAMPRHAVTCHATSCHSVPHHAMPPHMPCHAMPCHAITALMCCHADPMPLCTLLVQADLVCGVLAALPPGLTSLQLATPCAGPVLGIIGERFTRLQRLEMLGCDGDAIDWRARGTAAAMPLLTSLELNYSTPDYQYDGTYLDKRFSTASMGDDVAAMLRSASRLAQLSLALQYSTAVGELWASLPALRHLRCAAGPEQTGNLSKAECCCCQPFFQCALQAGAVCCGLCSRRAGVRSRAGGAGTGGCHTAGVSAPQRHYQRLC